MTAAKEALFSRGFVLLLAVQTVFGIALSILLLLPKVVVTQWHGGPVEIGVLAASYGIGSIAGVPVVGVLVDRLGLRGALASGCALMAVSAVGFVPVHTCGAAALGLRALQGVSFTLVFSAGMVATSVLTPTDRLAQALGIYGSSNLSTFAIGPLAAEPLLETYGAGPLSLVAAAIALTSAVTAFGLRLPPPSPSSEASLRALFSIGRNRRIAAIVTLVGTCMAVVLTFHQPYALEMGVSRVRTFFAGYSVGAIGVRVLGGRLLDRLGHRRSMMLALFLFSLATAAMRYLAAGRLLVLGIAFGGAQGLFVPACLAFAISGVDLPMRGRLVAVINGCLMVGAVFVPPLAVLVGAMGYGAVFVGLGAVMLLSLVLTPPR